MSKPDDWKCEACDGTGMAVPDCEECSGNGWVDDEEDGGTMTCPSCNGNKCDTCGGSGEKPLALSRPDQAIPKGSST
jgi:DnaJ-class molecular chaperone